jgi:hypothetical protein
MLDICQQWTEEFRMSFNPAKCELIQLAGSTGQGPPALTLGGVVLSWVSEVKYLGVPMVQGRRCKIYSSLDSPDSNRLA